MRMPKFISTYDGQFYLVVESEAFSSRMWPYLSAFYYEYMMYYGRNRKMEAKSSRHVSEVAIWMIAIPSGYLVEADVHVDIWCYSYYDERTSL